MRNRGRRPARQRQTTEKDSGELQECSLTSLLWPWPCSGQVKAFTRSRPRQRRHGRRVRRQDPGRAVGQEGTTRLSFDGRWGDQRTKPERQNALFFAMPGTSGGSRKGFRVPTPRRDSVPMSLMAARAKGQGIWLCSWMATRQGPRRSRGGGGLKEKSQAKAQRVPEDQIPFAQSRVDGWRAVS